MSRLFHKGEWFYELSPTALLEAEFESLLVQNADVIRPRTLIVPYKKTVYADGASARADLAIISDDYREWLVVEVEMNRHSLYGHVIPQVRTLREASYGQDNAAYLAAKHHLLDEGKLADMMRGFSPEVLVIVNKQDDEWRRELHRYGARMMVFEIFRSDSNHYIFSIDGELPRLAHDIITHLEVDRMLPNFVVVASPAALTFSKGARIPIFVNEQLTEWERIDIQTSCYLTAVGRMPLVRGRKYALARTETGDFMIRLASDK